MKITEALFAEHLVFHNMFDHIEATAPRLKTLAEVKSLAALMEQLLKAHSDTEDELFIGPLEHCFEQIGQRDAFLEEHQEIDDSLRNVQERQAVQEGAAAVARGGGLLAQTFRQGRAHRLPHGRARPEGQDADGPGPDLDGADERGWRGERRVAWARPALRPFRSRSLKSGVRRRRPARRRASRAENPTALPACRKAASCG